MAVMKVLAVQLMQAQVQVVVLQQSAATATLVLARVARVALV
jgi:hypothetical protein